MAYIIDKAKFEGENGFELNCELLQHTENEYPYHYGQKYSVQMDFDGFTSGRILIDKIPDLCHFLVETRAKFIETKKNHIEIV